jgi:septum formation protein
MTYPLKIVLASTSPRRRELMERLPFPFRVIEPEGVEETQEGVSEEVVILNATAKACAVAERMSESLVIGADTVVVIDEVILGKARDAREAEAMLRTLSGRAHRVLTGLTVVDAETGRTESAVVETSVWLHSLTDEDIEAYIETGESIGKAGGYAIQGAGGRLVERIEGSYENVVGLPISRLRRMLGDFGFDNLSRGKSDIYREGRRLYIL